MHGFSFQMGQSIVFRNRDGNPFRHPKGVAADLRDKPAEDGKPARSPHHATLDVCERVLPTLPHILESTIRGAPPAQIFGNNHPETKGQLRSSGTRRREEKISHAGSAPLQ